MIVKEEKIKRKERKRERMLEVAAELFSKKNYHEVMMDDVARLTDVAKGTVYNYFSSKEELYFTIMSSKLENLNTSLKNKIASEISVIDSLHTYVIHLYMFMMKYKNFFLMYQKEYMNAQNEFCDELRAMSDELKSILSDIIYKGKRENQFRDVDESFSVKLVLGSIFGAVQRGVENKYTGDKLIEEREKLFDFILHGLYSGFNNSKVRPLKNKTIVLTRTVEQSKESAAIFSELGADVIVFPTLEIVPPGSWEKFDDLILSQEKIDFIVFTSAHAVTMFIKRTNELKIQIDFERIKVVAVGNKTKSVCEENNIKVDILPKKFSGEGIVEELSKHDLKDKLIFIPRSAIGREDLPKGLEELGAKITAVPVYNVSLPSKESV
ncbi:MAG TPA: uroporphyrinogen-III synthase, partial [Ignavibacteriaceae bacterium]